MGTVRSGPAAERARRWWSSHDRAVLAAAVCLMAVVAAVWLTYETYRLLWQPEHIGALQVHTGAIDFKLRFHDVTLWFAGDPIYETCATAIYPPATMALLWPLLGWLAREWAMWLWAVVMALGLGCLSLTAVRGSGARTALEKAFVALIPLSMYAAGATVGNGQMMLHVLPALMAGVLLATRSSGGASRDLLAAGLILFGLAKPTVAAPFFWIVLLVPASRLPALGAAAGYGGLTVLASAWQEGGVLAILVRWAEKVTTFSQAEGAEVSVANLAAWFDMVGLGGWNSTALIVLLALLGLWTWRRRKADVWVLLGVAGLFARFWTYHRWYDDLLVLPALVCLFRLAKVGPRDGGTDVIAGVLLAVSLPFLLAPGGQYLLPSPWVDVYLILQTVTWLATLVFLVRCQSSRLRGSPSHSGAREGKKTQRRKDAKAQREGNVPRAFFLAFLRSQPRDTARRRFLGMARARTYHRKALEPTEPSRLAERR